jgi:peptidoglycan/LPS O-acetylase OafA/YrhL
MTRLDVASYVSDHRLWRFIWLTLTSFKSAVALPGVFEQNPLPFPMGTVWTLKYESLCYLGVLIAGIVGLLAKPRLALAAWLGLFVLTLGWEIVSPDGSKGVETALRLPLIFMTGGLIYLFADRVRLSLLGLAGALALVALLAATPLYKPLLFVATAWGILVLALHPSMTKRSWEPKTDISYGVYLYGWPVQQAAYALFPTLGALTLLWPCLVVTILIGLASWHGVEAPALRLKRRLMGAGAVTAPGTAV